MKKHDNIISNILLLIHMINIRNKPNYIKVLINSKNQETIFFNSGNALTKFGTRVPNLVNSSNFV